MKKDEARPLVAVSVLCSLLCFVIVTVSIYFWLQDGCGAQHFMFRLLRQRLVSVQMVNVLRG